MKLVDLHLIFILDQNSNYNIPTQQEQQQINSYLFAVMSAHSHPYLTKAPFSYKYITASVRERPLQATWALLLLPTWLAAAVREPTLLFVTERGLEKEEKDEKLATFHQF